MPFDFPIPTTEGQTEISVEAGSSVVFVGANGGGKTRLAVHIEETLSQNAHRISAHRALTLNPSVAKIGEKMALAGLRTGNAAVNATIDNRLGSRWQRKAAVSLLNDFDFLVQVLFGDQANKSLETHKKVRAGDLGKAEPTKFEQLTEIWERLLPRRKATYYGRRYSGHRSKCRYTVRSGRNERRRTRDLLLDRTDYCRRSGLSSDH